MMCDQGVKKFKIFYEQIKEHITSLVASLRPNVPKSTLGFRGGIRYLKLVYMGCCGMN